MVLEILKIGNPLLREISKEIELNDIKSDRIQQFIDDLVETMHDANGAGIAAIQVGNPIRVFAMEVNKNPRYPYKPNIPLTVMINPKIEVLNNDLFDNYEGCLSVPILRAKVKRHLEIKVSYYDREANYHDTIIRGITAGTVQHEYDHLDGLLFMDKVEDTTSLSTWDEFQARYQDDFAKNVKAIVEKYGS